VQVIVEEATGASREECLRALDEADGDTKTAIVSLLAGVDATTARAALEAAKRRVRHALAALGVPTDHPVGSLSEVPMEE
jgi:N-acetylmuramic acid 6-phosphate etherase